MIANKRTAVMLAAVVGCSLAAALWVRSYWAKDVVYGWLGLPGYFQIDSSRGSLQAILNYERQKFLWRYDSYPPESLNKGWQFSLNKNHPWFGGWWLNITVPHYSAVPMCGLIAATAAWVCTRRFRIRTLLLATALIAVVLGILAAA